MKDMRNYYYNMTTQELRTLKSKKYLRTVVLRRKALNYFDKQELRKLETQMSWIDAVLESRFLQGSLFP